jgi:glycosyltransferase involved in cell wall biosynthesis/tetratricopeptide (TPR) repeat protein
MINPRKPDYQNTPAAALRPQFAHRPADISAPPVVTIVTPFFNAGRVFYETSESVFRQTLQQWEWLIINDGSSNAESLQILDEYRRKDPRIRVVDHPENRGLSAARNTGFREARAEFIFQLDADDLIEPATLEIMAWHLATHPGVAFTTGFTVGFGSKEYLWQRGFHSGTLFLQENPVTATCLVRKSVQQAVGGYEEGNRGGLEDWDFWLKSASRGHWGSTIPEYLDWYRRRDEGREHWDNATQKEKFEKFRARLEQKYPKLWQEGFPVINPLQPQQLFFAPPTDPPFQNRLVKEKPRLLFIVPHLELGGADKFNLDLIQSLQQSQGWQVTVASTRPAKDVWQHEFENLTPDVFVLPHFLKLADYPRFLGYLINSRQVDAVCISNSHLGYQLLPWLRAQFPELPFLDYLHMEEEAVGGGYPRCSILYQSQIAKTMVSSRHLKDWMVAHGAEAQRIEVCHTNIDSERWSRARHDLPALRKKWNLDPARPVILHAGRICEQKQPRVFAQVMRQLAEKNPSFTALVAGDGPDFPWLKEFVERERLKQVRLLGALSNDEMAELFAVSDIFFLPSQWEGISLAVYEAMAMEVVPVVADVGGQRELVTPECGMLVRRGPNEQADYANALQKLLKSPELRQRMASAARERVSREFNLKELGSRVNETLEAARNAMGAGPRQEVPSTALATLHATEALEQVRSVIYAEQLIRDHNRLVPYARHSVEWQAFLRTGQALAELKHNQAAVRAFEDGIKRAAACGMADVELSARVEIAQALVPLDRKLAEAILSAALPLAQQLRNAQAEQSISKLLQKLRKSASPVTEAAAPAISVVIPCYKQAHFLPEAVESVLAQTFVDFEIIIVNDGSPDNTGEVARGIIEKNPDRRIRLVEKANGGLPSARNAGFKAALGKYVLPLDADDQIKPTMLEKLKPILDQNPKLGFAYSHIQHFGDIDTEWPLPDFDANYLITKDNMVICCALVRKSAWEQVGGYNEIMRDGYEDWDFWIGCVEHGWTGQCHHEPLFLYRKHGHSMITDANAKRERIIARIVLNHPKLYSQQTQQNARELLDRHAAAQAKLPAATGNQSPSAAVAPNGAPLRITYLISSILGVTGGNQTLLRQAEEMRRRGHDVTIVTGSAKPDWFQFQTRVVQVPAGKPMASCVPPSDVVVATYFINATELVSVNAPVKVYYAQGDQYVFGDATMADTELNRRLRELSKASYLMPGIRFVPNSRNLANAVEKLCGRKADGILPVCTDQTIFRPLQRSVPGSKFRLLVVGPDSRGTEAEPLLFKGIQDIHDALQILARRYPHFTAVRMSGTPPDIFARFPCEFYIAPGDEMKTALFGASHIHIYASHYDSCPRPPQEAMAAGCAVVCTATPGALEYCRDGENSLLVPVKSPEAIADAVERLIKDHELREKLVQGGLATAREFPREREWNEWENLLRRFVDEAAGTALKPALAAPKPAGAASKSAPKRPPLALPACALLGRLTEARELLKKKQLEAAWNSTLAAMQSRPFHPEASMLLAEIALAAGDSVSARQCAQHARNIAPEWKPARQFLKGNLRGNQKNAWLALPEPIADPSRAAAKLSVCLIAKNEQKFLGQCLASVRELAAQIVVVDTGSSDRTIEIAKQAGAEVHEFAWNDDFSAARNEALKFATGDWVLFLDADEELLPAHRETILQEMQAAPVMAWRLPIIDKGREQEGCSYVPRLFRNAPGLFYVGRVHEQVFTSIEVRRQEWGLENRLGKSALLHHGYTNEMVAGRDKVARNLRLLERAIGELPDEPNLLMSLGLELTRSGRLHDGLERYQQSFQLMSALPAAQVVPELRETLLTQYPTQLMAAKRFSEIIQLWQTVFAKSAPMTASQHFVLGLAELEMKQPAEAAEQMRQCIAKRDRPALSPVNPEIFKAGPNHCLALALAALKQNDAAAMAFEAALADEPKSRPARFDFARFQFERGEALEALKLLTELTGENPDNAQVWQFGGQIALSRPEFFKFARDWTGEAHKHFPQHPAITLQRAEALLLGQDAEAALPLWTTAHSPKSARHLAAMAICEAVAGNSDRHFAPGDEPLVSQELLKWYRLLLAARANGLVTRLNENMENLRMMTPSFVEAWEAAAAEARREPVAV